MFKKIFSLSFVFLFSLFFAISAYASDNSLKIEEIKTENNSISITWSGDYESYNVYKDDNLVYSGKDNSYISNGLESGNTYSYMIEAIDNKGKVEDSLKLQTSTEKPNKDIFENLNDLIITTIVKKNEISLDWEDIDGVTQYEVYKNDNYYITVKDSEFTDNNINPSENYTYSIVAKKLMDQDKIKEINESIEVNNITLTEEEKSQLYYEELNIVKEINNINSHLQNQKDKTQTFAVAAAASTKQWNLRYTTFLADKWVANPNPLSKYRWFTGDNRGYSATASSYRTRADVNICFCSAGSSVGINKYVGKTHGYDSNKKFLGSGTASSKGISLSNVSTGKSKITFKINHAVGNPLVTALNVDYTVNAEFNSNGKYKLSGDHDQAPHHEVYLKGFNSSSYQTMHRAASKGLAWLAPPMVNKQWSKSNF